MKCTYLIFIFAVTVSVGCQKKSSGGGLSQTNAQLENNGAGVNSDASTRGPANNHAVTEPWRPLFSFLESEKNLQPDIKQDFNREFPLFDVVKIQILSSQTHSLQFDLGFGKNRVMVLPSSEEINSKYEMVKNRLLNQEGVEAVAYSSRIPSGRLLDSQGGAVEVDGEMKNLDFRLADVHTDFDFLSTMEIPIISGRDFNKALASDSSEAFIINEAAVKASGWPGDVLSRY